MVIFAFGFLGTVLGSFMAAQVWRLRAHQLVQDKAAKQPYDVAEYKQLLPLTQRKKGTPDRSRCLHCGHTLAWYDLLPIVSWLRHGGRCRYCGAPIGRSEILMEVGVGLVFAVSYAVLVPLTPQLDMAGWRAITLFVLWLVAVVIMAGLWMYDAKWYLLPRKLTNALIIVGILYAGLSLAGDLRWERVYSLLLAEAVLCGLYAALYYYSRWRYGEEKTWVGFGDVHLTFGLALLLVDWRLAAAALFLANFLGTLLVLPGLVTRKINRSSRIPFGPLLIAATIIVYLSAQTIFVWFERYLLPLS